MSPCQCVTRQLPDGNTKIRVPLFGTSKNVLVAAGAERFGRNSLPFANAIQLCVAHGNGSSSLDMQMRLAARLGMISAQQAHIARLSLNLSMAAVAKQTGIALNTVKAIEAGADSRRSTLAALESTFRDEGVLFGSNGGVGVKMDWTPNGGRPSDPRIRGSVLRILNAARKSRGQAPYIDTED